MRACVYVFIETNTCIHSYTLLQSAGDVEYTDFISAEG